MNSAHHTATLAKATRRPSEVVGLRLYPGMQKHRMAEIIPSTLSSPRAIATVRALARKLDRDAEGGVFVSARAFGHQPLEAASDRHP